MKLGKIIVSLALLAGALGGGYWWWSHKENTVENPYKTAPVERRDVSVRVTASGTLQARVTVQVGSQVSGRLLELDADFNSAVKKGQVVAKLDPQLFEASVAKSRANFNAAQAAIAKADVTLLDAKRTYERVKAQRGEGLSSQQEVDTAETAAAVAKAGVDAAKASLEQARAQLHQDEVNLSLTVIRSPIDGVVISRAVDVGQTVAASLQAPVLFTIAEDLTKMRLEASIPESDVGKLNVGMDVQFTVDAFAGRRFRGVVSQVRNAAVTLQNVVTYTAIIAVDNPELQLRPGMTATVNIVTATRQHVLAIPNAALRFRPPGGAPDAMGSGTGERGGRWRGSAEGAPTGSAAAEPATSSSASSAAGSPATAPSDAASAAASSSAPSKGAHKHGRTGDGKAKSDTSSVPAGSPSASGSTEVPAPGALAPPPDNVERKLIWTLRGTELQPQRVRIGISDGSYTELLDDSLHEGDAVVVEGPPPTAGAAGPGGAGAGAPGRTGATPGASPNNSNFRMRGIF
jgi:HlyD family secretion protein